MVAALGIIVITIYFGSGTGVAMGVPGAKVVFVVFLNGYAGIINLFAASTAQFVDFYKTFMCTICNGRCDKV